MCSVYFKTRFYDFIAIYYMNWKENFFALQIYTVKHERSSFILMQERKIMITYFSHFHIDNST